MPFTYFTTTSNSGAEGLTFLSTDDQFFDVFNILVPEGGEVLLDVHVAAGTGTDSFFCDLYCGFRRPSGGSAIRVSDLEGSGIVESTFAGAPGAVPTINFTVSGNIAKVRARGKAATNISWKITVEGLVKENLI